jgi:hypothetical protein
MENLILTLKDIRESWLTNHQRLKYNDELLYAVVMRSYSILDEQNIWEASSITMLIKDVLTNQLLLLALCVEPFNALNGDGFIQPLYENLPKLTKLFSVCKKPQDCKKRNIFTCRGISCFDLIVILYCILMGVFAYSFAY